MTEHHAPDPGAGTVVSRSALTRAAVTRARRFTEQNFSLAETAFLGGSAATGEATASSDLDILVVLPNRWADAAFVETTRCEGQLVEAFVYGRAALQTWLERGRAQRRPVLDRLAADGIPLISGPLTDELSERSRAVITAGPDPADADDLARRAYSLSAHLDDLTDRNDPATGTDSAETAILTWTLWQESAELALLVDRQWLGTGKWWVRELRRTGDRFGLAAWAEAPSDLDRLVTVARTVLDSAGGYRQEGFVRGDRPTDL